MAICKFVAAAALLATSSHAARMPNPNEAKLCVTNADHDLLAGVWNGDGHLCSEYFQLEQAEVTDISKTANTADVMVSLRYRVLKLPEVSSVLTSVVQICTGAMIPGSVPAAGSTLPGKDRKISMQEWSSGWKCKD